MKQIIRRVAALVIGLGLGAVALAGLESVTHISDLNASWPLGSDLASTSDDHIRNIKTALKTDFPNITGPITATQTQLNAIVATGITGFANPSASVGLTAVNGTASTVMRSDAAPAVSQAIVPTWTGVHTFSAKPVFSANITVGGATFSGLANPSASAGLSAINGVATTAMRSDAAPALDQTIAPQWTGLHIFKKGGETLEVLGSSAWEVFKNDSAVEVLRLGTVASWLGSGSITDASVSAHADLYLYADNSINASAKFTTTAIVFSNSTDKAPVSSFGPVAGSAVDMTPDIGTFTATYTGFTAGVTCTATWSRIGKLVSLFFCAATGTSNTGTFTMTGLPSAIQPASLTQTVALPIGPVQNATLTDTTPSVTVTSGSGTVTFLHTGSSIGWSTSGIKGFSSGATISYLLN